MATIGMMVLGAILNATAFTGGTYLAKSLSGDSTAKSDAEQKKHDLAMEKFQTDKEEYQKKKQEFCGLGKST